MGREVLEVDPLERRFAYLVEAQLLQQAEAAVQQLRRGGRGGSAEVAPVDQRDREPTAGGVERDAGSADPGADDDDVELGFTQLLDVALHAPYWVVIQSR